MILNVLSNLMKMSDSDPVIRKIIHVDMDAFYASVEQRDRPELKGLPLAVGGDGKRGVIAAASYEARKFGVKSAMNAGFALRKCPMLRFVRPDFDKYKAVSKHIREIFERYTDVIEPLSLDEAFLDVTFSPFQVKSATIMAQHIKNDIKNELDLIASAGISYNKFLAKLASDEDKPDGLFVIPPDKGKAYVEQLPIEEFFGVGKVTAKKMRDHGILCGKDLMDYSKWELQKYFGKSGGFLFDIARGIDNREVNATRIRKSIGAEMTFQENISDSNLINEKFTLVFDKWWTRYQSAGVKGKSITLKIRNQDFETITRSFTETKYITDGKAVRQKLIDLLWSSLEEKPSIRLLGISISGLEGTKEKRQYHQLSFW